MKIVEFVKKLVSDSGIAKESKEYPIFEKAHELFAKLEAAVADKKITPNFMAASLTQIDALLQAAKGMKPQSPALGALILMLELMKEEIQAYLEMAKENNSNPVQATKAKSKIQKRAGRSRKRVAKTMEKANVRSAGQKRAPSLSRDKDGKRIARIVSVKRVFANRIRQKDDEKKRKAEDAAALEKAKNAMKQPEKDRMEKAFGVVMDNYYSRQRAA
ncbi:MAG: hypothetical protein LBL52_02625 [Rickettsiales bacterium]|jgi:hypothetical protein|nr:hypothetical protein [Rickettsiales bacterium]